MAYGGFKDLKRRASSDKVLDIKDSILLKILNMMGIEEGLLLWFKKFWKKSLKIEVSPIMRLNKFYNQLKNYTNQLLKIKKKKKFIQDLKIIFGVLI